MTKPALRPWYLRIGPGLITACVVIGPGSVLTSSKVGAKYGFAMNWVVVISVIFMVAYVSLGAKLGAVTRTSPCTLVAQRAGRWLAVLIGLSVFLISALFQFGNNLGAHAAIDTLVPKELTLVTWGDWRLYIDFSYVEYGLSIVILNALTLVFVFGFKNLYKALERLMMVFVALMLISFAANLALAGWNWFGSIDRIPSMTPASPNEILFERLPNWVQNVDLSVLALVGTTFVISAAFLQPYLVQQKGWGKDEVKQGRIDSIVGGVIMALITLMIISTSAIVFHYGVGQSSETAELNNVAQIAVQLRFLLGNWAQFVFCLGLFSAAYSSFLVNSMIGGFILSDGLGLGSDPHERAPRACTAIVLMVGMLVALYVINTGLEAVAAIVTAQALVVLAAPLLAGVMLWLTNLPSIMGQDRNRWPVNVVASLGLLMLLAISADLAVEKVAPQIKSWLSPPDEQSESDEPITQRKPPGR